ncbi:MAG: hypothetical protein AAF740_10800, partial [Bacteroidota bacterium]
KTLTLSFPDELAKQQFLQRIQEMELFFQLDQQEKKNPMDFVRKWQGKLQVVPDNNDDRLQRILNKHS